MGTMGMVGKTDTKGTVGIKRSSGHEAVPLARGRGGRPPDA
mgnify:CR=1 FL=1